MSARHAERYEGSKRMIDQATDGTPGDRLVNQEWILANYLPIDRTTFWRLRRRGGFPEPLDIPDLRIRLWRLADVLRWAEEHSNAKRLASPPRLRRAAQDALRDGEPAT
jgi:predicted DNA-binding transcriptional regulator AlpA